MFSTVEPKKLSQVTSVTEKSTAYSDAHNAPENIRAPTQRKSTDITLKMLIKEMVCCVALALTTYGALHNTSSKVSRHPQAVSFFGPDSIITDWYNGDLSKALVSMYQADISFVMYYAPWDAESQYVRGEFEKAAMILGDRVHFVAINCWNPGSECRLQYNKISSWPILVAYTVISRGAQFKGPKDAHSMVTFLELVMQPLKRISSTDDLIHLLSSCDAVAVGFTPLSSTSTYYNTWYHVSLKIREFDTIGEICLASVVSEQLAIDFGVEMVPNVRLMLWNDTKEFMSDDNKNAWNESSLTLWLLENFSQPVARIIPLWRKAFSFDRFVDGNPILILFTPLNPVYEQLPTYSLVKEVAMEYYNCRNNDSIPWTTELIKLQRVQRLIYQQKNFVKFCQEYKFEKPLFKHKFKKEVESQNNVYPFINITNKPSKSSFGVWGNFFAKAGLGVSGSSESSDDSSRFWSLDWLKECSIKTFPAERSFYDNYEHCKLFDQNNIFMLDNIDEPNGDLETLEPVDDDPLAPENLLQENIKHFCQLYKFAQEFSPMVSSSKNIDEEISNFTNIKGLSCAYNFSMNVIAIDSVRNHHFAESLGIDVLSMKDMTAVVILDSKQESQYILSEELSAKSLRDFIYNFTHKRLKRSLRTHVDDAAHTHFFGSEGKSERTFQRNDTVHIPDLTTKTFRRFVDKPGTVSIVCVCNGGCGAGVVRAAVEGARRLRAGGVPARVARLDARRHDLPWHYTPHAYPAVIVFSNIHYRNASGKLESRSYPAGSRVTAGGVAALALHVLPPPMHWHVRLTLCIATLSNIEKKTCLKDMREHITAAIGSNLRYWRGTKDRELKDALFKRLQHLNQVSLELSVLHAMDLQENNLKLTLLLDSFSNLFKIWDFDVSFLKKHNLNNVAVHS